MHKKELRELLCSMLLGDGCLYSAKARELSKKHKHPKLKLPDVFFAFTHSKKQYDYAIWKAELINNIFVEKNSAKRCTISYTKKIDKKTGKKYEGVYVKLRWAKYFRHLRKWTHTVKNGLVCKDVNYLLGQMKSDLHTAIWFMDDGNEKRDKKRGKYGNPYYRLFTYSFDKGENKLIQQWFERTYEVKPRILFDRKRPENKQCYLVFSPEESKILFLKLGPYFSKVKSMKYKFRLSFDKYALSQKVTSSTDEDIVHPLK